MSVRYLSPLQIGNVTEYFQSNTPVTPNDSDIWVQTGGNPNAIWIWNSSISKWISSTNKCEHKSLELTPLSPEFTGSIQLLPINQSGYGLFISEIAFTGLTTVNNNLTNRWTMQLFNGLNNLGLRIDTNGAIANTDILKFRSLLIPLMPTDGSIVRVDIAQVGSPGVIRGIFSLSYRLIYG